MNRLERGLASLGSRKPAAGAPRDPPVENVVTPASVGLSPSRYIGTDQTSAMKLSAVSRCIDILSDSIGKMPFYVYDVRTRQRVEHPVLQLLNLRPNRWQTPFEMRKQLEAERVIHGNGVAWIRRDERTLQPLEIVPIPWGYWNVQLLPDGSLLYFIEHPYTHEPITCGRMDVIHVKAYSRDGYRGIGYLERAEEVIRSGIAAQEYSASYYLNGGQPSGILRTDSDLGGNVTVKDADGKTREISKKDRIREEWEKRHSGPANAQRIAVLDMGLDYKPLSISNRDAQFVEQKDISVADIGRFFGIPLYKLMAGKQSYSSNEQNAIEYVVDTLHPITVIYEQEGQYKLFPPQDVDRGLRIQGNLMGELRGDFQSRGAWYKDMREIGVFSVNDILDLEDMPAVEGGDEHYASLNYVPLRDWRRLSEERAGSGAGDGGNE
ncbi:MAG: phage portal protein [Clostridia bacterium]|nr:phage portal protein [Clostridia bacterium]